MRPRANSLSMPITTRSGFMKSSMAAPSLRNSGLEHMWKGTFACRLIAAATLSAVPTGTVDFVTTTTSRVAHLPICSATARTCRRSAEPSSSGGVPTAMNTMSASRIAPATSVVKLRRPAVWLRSTYSSRPGS